MDIHGHSTKNNLFLYGCQHNAVATSKNGKGPPGATAALHKEKILSFIMQKTIDWFSYNDCNFYIHKSKETTGRVSIQSKPILNLIFNRWSFTASLMY